MDMQDHFPPVVTGQGDYLKGHFVQPGDTDVHRMFGDAQPTLESSVDSLCRLTERLRDLRDEKDRLKQKEADLSNVIASLEAHLFDLFTDKLKLDHGVKLPNGLYPIPRMTTRYSNGCEGGMAELAEFLRADGHGDLVTETVNANTMSAYFRREAELGHAVPGYLRKFDSKNITLRKV